MEKCNGNFVSYCSIKTNIVDENNVEGFYVWNANLLVHFGQHMNWYLTYIYDVMFLSSVNERTHFFDPLLTLHMPNIIGHD